MNENRKYYAPKKYRYSIIVTFLVLASANIYYVLWKVNVEQDSFYYTFLLFFLPLAITSITQVFLPRIILSPKGIPWITGLTPWDQLKSVTITGDSSDNEYVFIEKKTL